MTRILGAIVAAVLVMACGGLPSQPSVLTGTVGARIDSACSGRGITAVTVTIDGVTAGTSAAGGAVTKVVPVGSHTISGIGTGPGVGGLRWTSDTVVTTAANPDSIRFFAC